jgi:uncharacterized protein YkwD
MAKKQTHTTKGLRPPKKHFTKTHAKVYWPYLPLIALLLGSAFLNIWQPLQVNKPASLAYATEMSRSGLLSNTNTQRSNNGKASLAINDKLNASAQAKANDMVARNYWAHNTPDGQQPWIFFDAQGYAYTKAGENLATGYATTYDTIIGWMNSPTHRANMLDSTFTEVGFGFANSANYIEGNTNMTIIVAHYAKPVVASAVSPPPPAPAPAPAPVVQAAPTASRPAPTPEPEPSQETEVVVEETKPDEDTEQQSEEIASRDIQPINTDNPDTSSGESQRTSRIQILTGGNAPWSALVISIAGFSLAMIWLLKHLVIVKRYIIEGEHFVAHHPILDLIVVAIIALAVYLNQTAGIIL